MTPDSAPTEQWTPEQRDDLATLIELQADQPEDVADRVLQWIADEGFVSQSRHDSLMRCQVEITRLVEAELTKLREDAARWQYVKPWFAICETEGFGDICLTVEVPPSPYFDLNEECSPNGELLPQSEWPTIDAVIDDARHATGEQHG